MLTTLAVSNYRSLDAIVVPLSQLNVVTGKNGSGKSNLYRALRLISETAAGRGTQSLAREGGLSKALWAGPPGASASARYRDDIDIEMSGRSREAVGLRLGFGGEDLSYAIDFGFPPPPPPSTEFSRDPLIKSEAIWTGPFLRGSNSLVERRSTVVKVKKNSGWSVSDQHLVPYESIFTQIADPTRAPEVLRLRESIRSWRFYDHFRADFDAPARKSHVGTRTVALNHEGDDVAASWQTILEIGDYDALNNSVDDAFPNSKVSITNNDGVFSLNFHQKGLRRSLAAQELSDGTLRYLLWTAALHTPRPPPLMVLNEPETSLHPDLLGPLGRMIQRASLRSQMIVVSHSSALTDALEDSNANYITLSKRDGCTFVVGQRSLDEPPWHWPKR
jgi:predicted ATPase